MGPRKDVGDENFEFKPFSFIGLSLLIKNSMEIRTLSLNILWIDAIFFWWHCEKIKIHIHFIMLNDFDDHSQDGLPFSHRTFASFLSLSWHRGLTWIFLRKIETSATYFESRHLLVCLPKDFPRGRKEAGKVETLKSTYPIEMRMKFAHSVLGRKKEREKKFENFPFVSSH